MIERSRSIPACSLALILACAAAAQADTRVETRTYVGAAPVGVNCAGLDDGAGAVVGGACLAIGEGEGTVAITLTDDSGFPVPARFSFLRAPDTLGATTAISWGSFCDATGRLEVPREADRLAIFLGRGATLSVGTGVIGGAVDGGVCASATPAPTTGILEVTFD